MFADTVGFGLVRANRPVLLLCDRGQRANRQVARVWAGLVRRLLLLAALLSLLVAFILLLLMLASFVHLLELLGVRRVLELLSEGVMV